MTEEVIHKTITEPKVKIIKGQRGEYGFELSLQPYSIEELRVRVAELNDYLNSLKEIKE